MTMDGTPERPTPESRHLLTARAAAAEAATRIAAGDCEYALRVIVQAVAALHTEQLSADEVADILVAPPSTLSTDFDTLLATGVLWTATERGIDAPAWTHKPPLEHEWRPGYSRGDLDDGPWSERMRAEALPVFRRVNVLMREKDFENW